jgi:hypothetical protein
LRKLDDTFHNICGKFSNGMEWKKHDPWHWNGQWIPTL